MFMESLGFRPGERYAVAAARTEMISGLLIALGLGGPLGPAALVSTMVVAQTSVHATNGYFAQKNGVELGVMYATAALAIASAGYGRYSCDAALGWQKLREPALTALAFAGGVAAGLVILAQRSKPPGGDSTPSHDAQQSPDPNVSAGIDANPQQTDSIGALQADHLSTAPSGQVTASAVVAGEETVGF